MSKNQFFRNKNVFNVLFEAASEGIIIVDASQTIIAANNAAGNMFGYKLEELLEQPLNILIPSKHRAKHGGHFNHFLDHSEKRQMGHGRELYGVKKTGDQFPVEAGLNPFEINGERYVMSLIIDISVRKETQLQIKELNNQLEEKIKLRTHELQKSIKKLQKLNLDMEGEIKKRKAAEKKIKDALRKEKELNELKTKFLSLVSHEFKTPLSGILTSATLAEKYIKSEQQDKREKHLGTIRNKVHYLNNILNDFLSIERLETGNNQYKYTSFSIKNFINEVIYNANITLKHGQEIKYAQEMEDIIMYQDQKILELILSNLLSNSIKYSPENSVIRFDVAQVENTIIFEVEDKGIGIPQEDQKHIFERYFRAENALLNQGTGIGLNIAKTHLENLGGHIKFISIENVGTTFIVKIPILTP
ncbi:ATP-binding protein [Gillisia sp. M10.2A]|uniref:histidine kinase n=1 Tax=Gillisia lutea TaxID=2909668 RepID=A0ABS9ED78_9FLAO|nr:PAS domain-containing sensor histidine kinase [Gillisia lutea]MCF4100207.1 ATP-binding protein [Gillisia lutea]